MLQMAKSQRHKDTFVTRGGKPHIHRKEREIDSMKKADFITPHSA